MIESPSKTVFAADRKYVDDYKGDLFCLIQNYFEKSGDKTTTPGSVMFDIVKLIGSSDYILIVHETDHKPDGFMIGKLVGNVARILMAFLGKGLNNKEIIKEALGLFEGWAKDRKCIACDLYTHRHPKSYKSLETQGWRHNYTTYRKELT